MSEPRPDGDPFAALGDPVRREILTLLAAGDRSVQQLAADFPISRPAVSRHLRLLREAGFVTERPEGTRRIYRLREEGAQAVQAYLEQLWGAAAARFTLVAENTAAENTAAENTAAENTAAENTAAENTAAENTAAENTAAENTAAGDAAPVNAERRP